MTTKTSCSISQDASTIVQNLPTSSQEEKTDRHLDREEDSVVEEASEEVEAETTQTMWTMMTQK